MSAFHHHVADRSVKIDPGPALRAEGFRLAYTSWALCQAARAHAHTGSVEAAGSDVIEPCDMAALDAAADQDALDRWADDNAPPESWEPWCDQDRWELDPEPSEADRAWWAEQTADNDTPAFQTV
jgi:hypothetical protein